MKEALPGCVLSGISSESWIAQESNWIGGRPEDLEVLLLNLC